MDAAVAPNNARVGQCARDDHRFDTEFAKQFVQPARAVRKRAETIFVDDAVLVNSFGRVVEVFVGVPSSSLQPTVDGLTFRSRLSPSGPIPVLHLARLEKAMTD